jgi:prepilin-type processing-associated H-X9-DG protein
MLDDSVQLPSATPNAICGFSVLELLAVVTVIAVLTLLAVVGAATAKAKARRMECINNLHQIAIGFTMYADENNAYPADFVDFGNSVAQYAEVTPALPAAPSLLLTPGPGVDYSRIVLHRSKVFECPASRGPDYAGYGFNYWGAGGRKRIEQGQFTLGLNGALQPPLARLRLGLERVKSPSDMIAFGDIANDFFPFAANQTMSYFFFADHKDGANSGFCDGHVEFAAKARVKLTDHRMRRRWNNDNEPHSEYWKP